MARGRCVAARVDRVGRGIGGGLDPRENGGLTEANPMPARNRGGRPGIAGAELELRPAMVAVAEGDGRGGRASGGGRVSRAAAAEDNEEEERGELSSCGGGGKGRAQRAERHWRQRRRRWARHGRWRRRRTR